MFQFSAIVEIVTCVNLYRNQLHLEFKTNGEELEADSEKLELDCETMRRGPKPYVSR